jgi:hypothetical protein
LQQSKADHRNLRTLARVLRGVSFRPSSGAPHLTWLDDPDHLRSHAKKPVKAAKISDPECKRLMLSIAEKWDELARNAHPLLRTKKPRS